MNVVVMQCLLYFSCIRLVFVSCALLLLALSSPGVLHYSRYGFSFAVTLENIPLLDSFHRFKHQPTEMFFSV